MENITKEIPVEDILQMMDDTSKTLIRGKAQSVNFHNYLLSER